MGASSILTMENETMQDVPQTTPLTTSGGPAQAMRAHVGLLIADPQHSSVVQAAATSLGLTLEQVEIGTMTADLLVVFDLVIVDEASGERVRAVLAGDEESELSQRPALVAALPLQAIETMTQEGIAGYEGLLLVPQAPSMLAAQLRIIVAARHASTARYRSVIAELELNRRIFRSVTTGISVANAAVPDMPLVYVNPAFEAMTGYTREEVLGKNCRFLEGSERDQEGLQQVREALRGHHETVVVLRNFRKDGTPFWNQLSLSPVLNPAGDLTHYVGIQTDVTTRIEFEAALRESEKLAAVGRLASSIAHEINNPLESVMNLVYLAERSETPFETRRYLAAADKELQRVKLITAQSLKFYKQSTQAQAAGCTELLDSVLDLYQSRLYNVQCVVERRERSTRTVVCMESEIRQVLNNLVSNAIDAMRGCGGRLLVRSREGRDWRSGRAGMVMTIADTGCGMGPEVLGSIYKAFYTTKGIGGTGLGLWISREIVDRHRGRLLVRSREQAGRRGTVFVLFLPFQEAAREATASPATA